MLVIVLVTRPSRHQSMPPLRCEDRLQLAHERRMGRTKGLHRRLVTDTVSTEPQGDFSGGNLFSYNSRDYWKSSTTTGNHVSTSAAGSCGVLGHWNVGMDAGRTLDPSSNDRFNCDESINSEAPADDRLCPSVRAWPIIERNRKASSVALAW